MIVLPTLGATNSYACAVAPLDSCDERIEMFGILIVMAAAPAEPVGLPTFFTGNQLYDACLIARSQCTGFIEGTLDATASAMNALGKPPVVCLTPNVTAGQLTDIVIQHYQRNPEVRHYVAATSVMSAIIAKFPCTKR